MAHRHHLFTTHETALPQIRAWIRASIGTVAQQSAGYQFIQAVDELCANIVEHADAQDEPRANTIAINLHIAPHKLDAHVTNAGDDFDLTTYTPPSLEDLRLRGHKGGMGIRLIGALSSKVNYRREKGINICTISKEIA